MPKVIKPRSYFRQYIVKNDNNEDICKFCSTKFGKKYMLDDRYTTLANGHYKIPC